MTEAGYWGASTASESRAAPKTPYQDPKAKRTTSIRRSKPAQQKPDQFNSAAACRAGHSGSSASRISSGMDEASRHGVSERAELSWPSRVHRGMYAPYQRDGLAGALAIQLLLYCGVGACFGFGLLPAPSARPRWQSWSRDVQASAPDGAGVWTDISAAALSIHAH